MKKAEVIKNGNVMFNNINTKEQVFNALPDIYSNIGNGNLNTKRIAEYMKLTELYNIDEGTIRDIFCKGAEWYKKVVEEDMKKNG